MQTQGEVLPAILFRKRRKGLSGGRKGKEGRKGCTYRPVGSKPLAYRHRLVNDDSGQRGRVGGHEQQLLQASLKGTSHDWLNQLLPALPDTPLVGGFLGWDRMPCRETHSGLYFFGSRSMDA